MASLDVCDKNMRKKVNGMDKTTKVCLYDNDVRKVTSNLPNFSC